MNTGKQVNTAHIVLLLLTVTILYFTSTVNYLLFHSLVEGFTVVVAALIYVLATKTHKYSHNDFFLFLGVGYLFTGTVDFFHLLSYDGMGVFSLGPDPPTQLWIVGRYLEAISLALAPSFLNRPVSHPAAMLGYGTLTCLSLFSILGIKVFPACFIVGQGLTNFKIISEYIICAIVLAGIFRLYRNRPLLEENIYKAMITSMGITILAELSFTLYTDVYGLMNLVGHLLKVTSFILIYYGVTKAGLENPYDFIFRELKNSSRTDHLTGLYNRTGFYESLDRFAKESLEKNSTVGILMMDLDNFKKINDSYGHLFGDEVLKQFGNLIKEATRKEDITCRIGGDEFVLITTADAGELEIIKQRLLEKVKEWIESDERLGGLGVSIGAAVCEPDQKFDIDKLIDQADKHMYREKANKPKTLPSFNRPG